jgi:tetrahydrodipicolinate N-succinyltransferase
MMQFEKDPIAYQLGHNSVITARIHIIQSTMEKMRKNYDAQWKELKKAGKVKKISKDEFIFE